MDKLDLTLILTMLNQCREVFTIQKEELETVFDQNLHNCNAAVSTHGPWPFVSRTRFPARS